MVKISFYGGVNQIGGNKILVEDKQNDASIFLDFGMNFTDRAKFFEEFIHPRTSNGLGDLLEMKLIPDLEGIYRHDLLDFAGRRKHEKPSVDAIVLSHAHLDHSAHISLIDERVPIFCSEITKEILKAVHETTARNFETEIIDFLIRPQKGKYVSRQFHTVKGKFKVNGLDFVSPF